MYLYDMAKHSYLELIWIRGHSKSLGNIAADTLTKRKALVGIKETDIFVGVWKLHCKFLIFGIMTVLEMWDLMLYFEA